MGVSRSTFYRYLDKFDINWRAEIAVEETRWPPTRVRRIVEWVPVTARALVPVDDLLATIDGAIEGVRT
jgi:hypothetical protein